ncbi:MAG: hypothetical protein JO000_00545 [Alphaproteobacteria bacterium]|nr:hypothetical protein [Alphaproteobacteria bacterium]
MLTMLAVVGLSVVPPAFDGSAIAGPAKHRVKRSACPYISRGEVIAAMLNGSLGIHPTSINGKRLCIDPTPYTYTVDPDGSTRLLWPRR